MSLSCILVLSFTGRDNTYGGFKCFWSSDKKCTIALCTLVPLHILSAFDFIQYVCVSTKLFFIPPQCHLRYLGWFFYFLLIVMEKPVKCLGKVRTNRQFKNFHPCKCSQLPESKGPYSLYLGPARVKCGVSVMHPELSMFTALKEIMPLAVHLWQN